ncbi:hypothetical protein EV641_109213 [Rhodococcus sp. SMB37]|uniref:hypothetical protein n=1 Tax=Rhodococcus sp. SMB37 TaxID=2512213 RepID=UPI00104A4524|nr:hypothetical protein [Rhodococcus sp. SMB37]TCN51822.1 hypothetical protein EV641_109213 [Rhodococcus sp. SMB37]
MTDRDLAAEYRQLTAQINRNATEYGYRTEDVWARNHFVLEHFPTVADELEQARAEIERLREVETECAMRRSAMKEMS